MQVRRKGKGITPDQQELVEPTKENERAAHHSTVCIRNINSMYIYQMYCCMYRTTSVVMQSSKGNGVVVLLRSLPRFTRGGREGGIGP